MNNLFLIAHKVRGEPAFDIAERMICPICDSEGCLECDDKGYWWIIPTSGHRAYPWEWQPFEACKFPAGSTPDLSTYPDHYPHSATSRPRLDIRAMLGKHLPPQTYIRRRL